MSLRLTHWLLVAQPPADAIRKMAVDAEARRVEEDNATKAKLAEVCS